MLGTKFAISLVGVSLVLGSASVGWTAPIASDSFLTTTNGSGGTYNSTLDGTGRLYGQNPTAGNAGFGGAWSNNNGTETADLRAQVGGLSHLYVVNPSVSNDGTAFATSGSSTRTVTRSFATFSRTEPEYYMSTLLRVATVPTSTSRAILGFSSNVNSSSTPNNGLQVGIDDGTIRLYYRNTAGTYVNSEVYDSVQANETYQIVLKIEVDVNIDSQEQFTVDIYDSMGDSVLAMPFETLGTLDVAGTEFGRLVMHKQDLTAYTNNTNTPRFDEFRFGTTLADVSTVPEPSSIVLLAIAAFGPLAVYRRRKA